MQVPSKAYYMVAYIEKGDNSMDSSYTFLAEKDEMWARTLMQVLKENDIPYSVLPVHGAGVTIKTGMQERLRVFVPAEYKEKASALLNVLFSSDNT